MRKLIVIVSAVSIVAVGLVAYAYAGMPTEVKYETKYGVVTFDHTAHKDRGDCKSCHHTGTFETCKTCHDGEKAPAAKTVYHKTCKDCHKAAAPELDSKKCKGCHIK